MTEPAKEAQGKSQYEEWADNFGVHGGQATLTRLAPLHVVTQSGKVQVGGFLHKYLGADNFPDIAAIKSEFGGGNFRISGRDKNGQLMRKLEFSIAGPPVVKDTPGDGVAVEAPHLVHERAQQRSDERARLAREEERVRADMEAKRSRASTNAMMDLLREAMAGREDNAGIDAMQTMLHAGEQRMAAMMEAHHSELRSLREHHAHEMTSLRAVADRNLETQREQHTRRLERIEDAKEREVARLDRQLEQAQASHAQEMRRRDDAHASNVANIRAQSTQMASLAQSQHDHVLEQMRTNNAHILAMKDAAIARQLAEIEAKNAEIEALKNRKDMGPLEALAYSDEIRDRMGGGPGIVQKVFEGISQGVAGRLLGDGAQPDSGEWMPQPEAPQTAQPAYSPWDGLVAQAPTQPQFPREQVEAAIKALDARYAARTQPTVVVQTFSPFVTTELRSALKSPGGLQAFLGHCRVVNPTSGLLTENGMRWLGEVFAHL